MARSFVQLSMDERRIIALMQPGGDRTRPPHPPQTKLETLEHVF
jgi:hypothetical protein